MSKIVHFSSLSDLWSTPQAFFDILNSEFHFTLDPCATKDNHKCEKYFTKEQDGLKQSWAGEVVFMNPPYGREIGNWMKKAARTFLTHGNTIVCLVPARTDTAWWHETVIEYSTEVRFIRGRLKFGGQKNNAPFPSAVVIYKENN